MSGPPSTRARIVAWLGSHVVPHEGALRARLRQSGIHPDEISDIVQDAYLAIARLEDVSHIEDGRRYFFQTAKNIMLMRLRRDRVVMIDRLTDVQALTLADDEPGPEQRVSAQLELERVARLIAALPERCRTIFELRRIRGLPQREIAGRLGIAEHIVEAQASRGLRLILKAIAAEDRAAAARSVTGHEESNDVRRP